SRSGARRCRRHRPHPSRDERSRTSEELVEDGDLLALLVHVGSCRPVADRRPNGAGRPASETDVCARLRGSRASGASALEDGPQAAAASAFDFRPSALTAATIVSTALAEDGAANAFLADGTGLAFTPIDKAFELVSAIHAIWSHV